ncbi:pentapeptide repeat-containing protein [Bacillus sp. 31A1R]|uniref:Pentapeptide repeat-containing protein n=1 Tax=Robertmurraya mangrovi TaxID=3098077 RepID=A0ABU5IW92_9BACI|nr:pentapeptide repeat-containing protein [Bacillus sp. 31A1R]MDZ5471413.1 pentapeptide repeat-containing protein [Bacillus sp. 31A1R]
MTNQVLHVDSIPSHLRSDCENCFGLCCVALPYAKSGDFAFDKDGGTPCRNLQSDYRCGIHTKLREKGFKGCTVYECFGAGQKVSQVTYKGLDWRENPESSKEMFDVFPIVQQLHEMLVYLQEALQLEVTHPLHKDLQRLFEETEQLTERSASSILALDIPTHRANVSDLLSKTSELVRGKVKKDKNQKTIKKGTALLGANLKGAYLRGSNFRGGLLIACNLQNADLRMCDFLGADLRDADISGANLQGSIFLTQAQINAANGDKNTKLPNSLKTPQHWLN